jgi:hypothetical protein
VQSRSVTGAGKAHDLLRISHILMRWARERLDYGRLFGPSLWPVDHGNKEVFSGPAKVYVKSQIETNPTLGPLS